MPLQPANATCPRICLCALRAQPAAVPSNPTGSAALRACVASMPRHSANAARSRHVAVHAGQWPLQGCQAAHEPGASLSDGIQCGCGVAAARALDTVCCRGQQSYSNCSQEPLAKQHMHLRGASASGGTVCVRCGHCRLLCPATPQEAQPCADVAIAYITGSNPSVVASNPTVLAAMSHLPDKTCISAVSRHLGELTVCVAGTAGYCAQQPHRRRSPTATVLAATLAADPPCIPHRVDRLQDLVRMAKLAVVTLVLDSLLFSISNFAAHTRRSLANV